MILPVPFPQSVIFHNLTNYTNLFDDCESCFYSGFETFGDSDNETFTYNDRSSNKLKVFNVCLVIFNIDAISFLGLFVIK